ncbi:MAG TPA: DEAD/DEAH box helicase [Gemmatimonadales bacterium]|nr:DEAD/DEAH box helicase [Gemmatimonadales bacterium]
MPFATLGLAPELVRAVADEGYEHPTPIQQEAIPLALAGRDVIGSAQTGTGKTAAFLLPILQRLAAGPEGVLRALVLVPTRELAEQVVESARAYGRHVPVSATAVYGGVGMEPQTRALARGVDIVIATPGRLLDHIGRGHLNFSRLEVLVLDEADRMLDMGFAPDVRRILELLPAERQTLLFSATISADVDRLAQRAMQGHASVEIGRRAAPAEGIEHVIIGMDKLRKRDVLARILAVKPEGRTLVFTRTKYGADKLVTFLRREGIPAHALHGDKAQSHRQRTLQAFRQGGAGADILIATDIAARGIDVDDIRMVVNYDVPTDPEVYVHRVGRTARAGQKGVGLTLMSPDEWLLMADIEKLVGQTFPREVIPGFEPSMAPPKPRVVAAHTPRPLRSVRARAGRVRRS